MLGFHGIFKLFTSKNQDITALGKPASVGLMGYRAITVYLFSASRQDQAKADSLAGENILSPQYAGPCCGSVSLFWLYRPGSYHNRGGLFRNSP
ncbi:MAG: hypothetical protein R3B47_08520 [Bacteroidia bacterium]